MNAPAHGPAPQGGPATGGDRAPVVRILSQGMDQKLTLKTRLLLNMHYLICRWCQRYSEHLRYLRKFSRRFPEQISTLDVFTMPASAKDRIKRKVGESAGKTL